MQKVQWKDKMLYVMLANSQKTEWITNKTKVRHVTEGVAELK